MMASIGASSCRALRQVLLRRPAVLSVAATRCFSSSRPQRIELPPNLKIDPSAKNSPFMFQSALAAEEEEEESDTDGSENDKSSEESDDESDDEDEFEEKAWFEPPTPILAVPLPERLHVDVLDKYDLTTTAGTFHLSPVVFGQDPIRVDILQRCVVYQRNKKRGKRKAITKTISEISGSGKKMRPQKGGGTSRAGHKRPSHWRGGAKAHGPKGKIQDYTTKLNKKVRRLGMVHAMSQKLKEGNLMVVNDLMLDSHKTKELASLLESVGMSGLKGKSAFIVDMADNEEEKVYQNLPIHLAVAVGNIPRVKLVSSSYINVYDMLKHDKLVMTLGAVEALQERFKDVTY